MSYIRNLHSRPILSVTSYITLSKVLDLSSFSFHFTTSNEVRWGSGEEKEDNDSLIHLCIPVSNKVTRMHSNIYQSFFIILLSFA